MIIRKIEAKDNLEIEQIIKKSLTEFGLPSVGTTFEDKALTMMYETYQSDREVYFVIEIGGKVYGGGGIKPLEGSKENICELQKMYFAPSIRGNGYGKPFFNKCIQAAKGFGYEKCYLESASNLEAAIHVYENNGFQHLNDPIGNTGHYSCQVWMLKDLKE